MSDFFGYITQRRQRQRRHSDTNTNEDLNITTDLNNCTSSNSVPEMSDEEQCDEITQLQNKIKELTLGLEAAHAEVESLNLENTQLKKTIDELTKKKNIYKKITTDIVSENSKSPLTNKKRNQKTNITNNSPQTTPKIDKTKTICLPTQTADKSTQYDTQLMTSLKSDKNLNKKETRKNICILSNNKRNNLSNLIENNFNMNDYCHYLYPGGDVQQMLQGIDNKIKNFNKNDYCVIIMGEMDFIRTGNYHDIIFFIRETIGKIKNTNVIICLPTYKYGYHTSIYNARIETFNNLLYLDNLTHEYAYLLDSNADLNWSYDMFSAQQGHVNGTGMKNIFSNLQRMVSEIDAENDITISNSSTSDIGESGMFFL